jgi:hypothetical protein
VRPPPPIQRTHHLERGKQPSATTPSRQPNPLSSGVGGFYGGWSDMSNRFRVTLCIAPSAYLDALTSLMTRR